MGPQINVYKGEQTYSGTVYAVGPHNKMHNKLTGTEIKSINRFMINIKPRFCEIRYNLYSVFGKSIVTVHTLRITLTRAVDT